MVSEKPVRIQLSRIKGLRGKNLACLCHLPVPGELDICHAAVLLEIANGVLDA